MAKEINNSLNDQKSTLQWQRDLEALKAVADEKGTVSIGSTTMGKYFEACMIHGLNMLSKELNSNDIPADKIEDFIYSVSRKINFNNMIGTGANSEAVFAFQNVKKDKNDKTNGRYRKKSNRTYAQIQNIKMEIEQLVRDFIGIEFCRTFASQIKKMGSQTINVQSIGVEGKSAKGAPVGDIKLAIGSEVFILEIKYQDKYYSEVPIRWFTALSDEKLFERGFANFIADNYKRYWDHSLEENNWVNKLQLIATKKFLAEKFDSDEKAILSYLISKGSVQEIAAREDPDLVNASKMVVHGHKGTLTITGTKDLINNINNELSGIRRQQRGIDKNYTLFTSQNGALIFSDSPGQQLAAFGLTGFGKGRDESTSKHKKYSTPDEIREKAKFSFSMWIAQKFLFSPKYYLGA